MKNTAEQTFKNIMEVSAYSVYVSINIANATAGAGIVRVEKYGQLLGEYPCEDLPALADMLIENQYLALSTPKGQEFRKPQAWREKAEELEKMLRQINEMI
jgi:hypothetical protein